MATKVCFTDFLFSSVGFPFAIIATQNSIIMVVVVVSLSHKV